MLAVCGGGGGDVVALLVAALAVAAWGLVAALVIRTAERRERVALIALTLVSSLVGPAILFGLLDGFDGDNDRLPEILITLLLPGLLAALVAVGLRAAHPGRVFFLVIWGAVLLIGTYAVLVIVLFLARTGC